MDPYLFPADIWDAKPNPDPVWDADTVPGSPECLKHGHATRGSLAESHATLAPAAPVAIATPKEVSWLISMKYQDGNVGWQC